MSDSGLFRAQRGKTGGCPHNHPKLGSRNPKSFFRVVPCAAWQNWRLSSKSPEIRHPKSEILLQSSSVLSLAKLAAVLKITRNPTSEIRNPKSFFTVVPCSAWQNWRASSKSPQIPHPPSQIL